MSRGNRFDRGYVGARLVVVSRDTCRAAWARAQGAVYGSREAAAADQAVTFQTACNWFDEFSTPTGDKVIQFAINHPAAFAALLREVAA